MPKTTVDNTCFNPTGQGDSRGASAGSSWCGSTNDAGAMPVAQQDLPREQLSDSFDAGEFFF